MVPDVQGALRFYTHATNYVARSGLNTEVEWQRNASFSQFSETDLLREAAWVILCAGFRESVVRRIFDYISLCFCEWESAESIVAADPACQFAAMSSFSNATKLGAISNIALHIHRRGFANFKSNVIINPISELQVLPNIGPVTVWHLAKNLGLNVGKPDRHLVRISAFFGFSDVHHFCSELARASGEAVKVVDLIVWRYTADNPKEVATAFAEGASNASQNANCIG